MSVVAEHRFVTVAGIRTHYVVAGSGPPVLLLHGLSANLMAWCRNIGPLAERHTVYALDLPGRGDSDKPDIDYSVPTGARFIREFMDTMGIRSGTLVGSSMGGILALRAAVDFPDRVDKLVLVAPAGLGRGMAWYVRALSLPLVGEVLEHPTTRGTLASLRSILFDDGLIQNGLVQAMHRTRQLPGAKQATLKMVRGGVGLRGLHGKWIMTAQLAKLDIPVLLVWGAQDRIIPVELARRAAQQSPEVSMRVFEQCGHWPHMEKADEFNQTVMEFLNQDRKAPDTK